MQVIKDAKAGVDTDLAHAKQKIRDMEEEAKRRLAQFIEEGAAAKRQAETERAKQDLVQVKLEEQISVLERTLELEASKLLTSEQDLSSSAQCELELKKRTSLLEHELEAKTARLEAELATLQQV